VSRTLRTRSPIGLVGFLLPQAISRDSMTYQHFVGISVGTWRKTSKEHTTYQQSGGNNGT
jgi:hypothetical protein